MIVNLLTEKHLEFLSLKGVCRASPESTLVKMSNCWKSHVTAHIKYGSRTSKSILPSFHIELGHTSCQSCCVSFKYSNYNRVKLCKTVTLKIPQNGFQSQLSLCVGQKYCRMLQGEHSAILLTFIKLPFVIKTFDMSVFEW